MSIYGSWLHLGDGEHEIGCATATLLETSPAVFEPCEKPCTCGQPNAPIGYRASHLLPSLSDPRGGALDVAAIPDFITRDGRDDAQEGAPKDFLRLSVYAPRDAVLLTRPQVEQVRDTLTAWLARAALDQGEGE